MEGNYFKIEVSFSQHRLPNDETPVKVLIATYLCSFFFFELSVSFLWVFNPPT